MSPREVLELSKELGEFPEVSIRLAFIAWMGAKQEGDEELMKEAWEIVASVAQPG